MTPEELAADFAEDPRHLWNGVLVCGKHKTWCGAQAEYARVPAGIQLKNVTDDRSRSNCTTCNDRYDTCDIISGY